MIEAVKFTHAVYNTDVWVYPDQVFAVIVLPTTRHTTLVGPGSVAIPVVDSIDDATKKINLAKSGQSHKE